MVGSDAGMTRSRALWALLLLLPAPSLGTAAGMIWASGTVLGQGLFFVSKVWVCLLPAVWHLGVIRGRWSWSPPRRGGLLSGAGLGVAVGAVIVAAYAVAGRHLIDAGEFQTMASRVGLADRRTYLVGAAYWILVNSVLEEYVWRWFVYRQFERLVGPGAAVVPAAVGFTVHHVVALRVYFSWPVTLIASTGVFIGGLLWSWCYRRYGSLWPGYLSHAVVDLVVFALGYHLLFG